MRTPDTGHTTSLLQIAKFMCCSAVTAPKAKGIDHIHTRTLSAAAEKQRLIRTMRRIARMHHRPGFERDAANIAAAPVIVLIGTTTAPREIAYCGFCGFENCAALNAAHAVCAYDTMDLGIAVGSAVSIAADFHIDNRIMYSAGKAAIELNLFGDRRVTIGVGIALSVSGKNIFFDRT